MQICSKNKPASIANRLVPYTIFMDPQLGRVSMTEFSHIRRRPNHRITCLWQGTAASKAAALPDQAFNMFTGLLWRPTREPPLQRECSHSHIGGKQLLHLCSAISWRKVVKASPQSLQDSFSSLAFITRARNASRAQLATRLVGGTFVRTEDAEVSHVPLHDVTQECLARPS